MHKPSERPPLPSGQLTSLGGQPPAAPKPKSGKTRNPLANLGPFAHKPKRKG